MNIVLEYILVFVLIYLFQYFLFVRNRTKYDKKNVPPELVFLKKVYRINLKKLKYKEFVYVYSFVNTFIMTTLYIILFYLVHTWLMRVILGIVLLVLLILICYGLLGRYYLWKEGRE